MQRIASVIGLLGEGAAEYERLHRDVWPGVREQISRSNIRNYSIYRFDDVLFSYFEYVGENLEADLAIMANDPATQEWWELCNPLQRPFPQRRPDEWWMQIPEIFHHD